LDNQGINTGRKNHTIGKGQAMKDVANKKKYSNLKHKPSVP